MARRRNACKKEDWTEFRATQNLKVAPEEHITRLNSDKAAFYLHPQAEVQDIDLVKLRALVHAATVVGDSYRMAYNNRIKALAFLTPEALKQAILDQNTKLFENYPGEPTGWIVMVRDSHPSPEREQVAAYFRDQALHYEVIKAHLAVKLQEKEIREVYEHLRTLRDAEILDSLKASK